MERTGTKWNELKLVRGQEEQESTINNKMKEGLVQNNSNVLHSSVTMIMPI